MRGAGLRRLQLQDRASDPQPYLPPLHVAAVEHQVKQASSFDDGIASVLLD
jgi:hypothetical protein